MTAAPHRASRSLRPAARLTLAVLATSLIAARASCREGSRAAEHAESSGIEVGPQASAADDPTAGDGGPRTPSAPASLDAVTSAATADDVGQHRPTVAIPTGAPPRTLARRDIVVGTGPEARAGAQVDVHYVGVAWSTGRTFDASWDRGEAFSFTLGARAVIPGWDRGVAGMRVGGRRLLVIPPGMGYGAQGSGNDIRPNETLVFVVDLVAVR